MDAPLTIFTIFEFFTKKIKNQNYYKPSAIKNKQELYEILIKSIQVNLVFDS